jgi:ASC-1-like (ASCH) protein
MVAPGGLSFRLSIIDRGSKRIPARLHDAGRQAVYIGKLLSFDDGIPFARTLKAVIVFATFDIEG